MAYIALLLSVIFLSVGFIVTRNNAKYILSGYNTMSEAKRALFDIEGYLKFFKRFHILLGISLFLGTVLISLINNNWASMFMTLYPLVAYMYMIIAGNKYNSDKGQKLTSYVVGGAVLLVAAFVVTSQFSDYETSELVLKDNVLEIKGSFGVRLTKQEILDVKLVDKLPERDGMMSKVGGFAAGDYAKGSFRLKGKKVVKLYVNKKISPIILLATSKGDVYYNSDEESADELYKKIRQWREL
ncbi:hypothetical protein DSL64_10105 [Dyadobacter luteus]|uniref:Bacterial Pleckstrin homology domain-containing protein n=1 Tax=Dyadobacter luteus TaxID=2259619 RepID=A0A3D8YD38_9BACT|nr:DUF3784 domain-containing protein [Dyadobacter luteus]REA62008.1 hypothetical protein DSL64_10105 [Dyadobacter luteus]